MTQDGQAQAGRRPRPWIAALAALLAALLTCVGLAITGPMVPRADAASPQTETPKCATGVDVLGFSDALNKQTYEGTSVGGLSALAYQGRRDIYYSLVDNGPTGASEARFYTLRLPVKGRLGTPEILDVTTLKDASGQPFTASNFDGEGLTLTRKGDLLASSETEPSIRRFDLDGNLLEDLPVPQRFKVAPECTGLACPRSCQVSCYRPSHCSLRWRRRWLRRTAS